MSGKAPIAPESYRRVMANLASVLLGLGALAYTAFAPRPAAPPPKLVIAPTPPKPPAVVRPKPKVAAPVAPDPDPPKLDRAALVDAELEVDVASRDRARAEGRAQQAEQALAQAVAQAQLDESNGKKLLLRVRDPSSELALVASQGGFIRSERDRLKDEVAAIRKAPRPKPKLLADKTPVARPTGGDEYHFEIRRNRVTFIDLDRLVEMVKSDSQLRVRLTDDRRLIESQVGPVGAFSLHYAMGRANPGIGELMERHGIYYDLKGWELVPEFEGRGETYETTKSPLSDYARAVNRLNPARATITMWIYPDGFSLYRKLRDDLHDRGYLVAARPLPDGMSIRGSPAGSLSAGQ